jgi:hypothetical protein
VPILTASADFDPCTTPAHRSHKAQSFITTMEDGALVLGTPALKGRRPTLETNSAARAEGGKALLEAALGELVERGGWSIFHTGRRAAR